MEKRTVLAIVLSLLVLLVYNALVLQPGRKINQKTEILQPVADKYVKDVEEKKSPAKEISLPKVTSTSPAQVEKLETFDTDRVTLTLSSKGGVIKSAAITEYLHSFPLTNMMSVVGYENADFELVSADEKSRTYRFSDGAIEILKKFKFSEDGHFITADVSIKNFSNMSKLDNGFQIFTI